MIGSGTVVRRAALSALLGVALFVLCLLTASVEADVVYLKNGTSFEGVITRETDEEVVLATDAGTLRFAREDVERIEKKRFEPVQIPRPEPEPEPQPEPQAPSVPQKPSPEPAPGEPAKPELRFNSLQELDLSPANYWLGAFLVAKGDLGADAARDHVGYNHSILAPLRDKSGYRLTVESVLLKYSRRLDAYLLLEVTTNRKFEPVSYTAEALSPRSHIRVVGEKQGDQLLLTTTTAQGTKTRTMEYPADCVIVDSSMYHLLAEPTLSPGSKRQYKFFDLLGGLKGVEQLEVLKAESIRALERKFDTWVVKTRTLMLDSPPMDVQRWLSQPTRPAGGRLLKASVGDGSLVYEASTQAQATEGVEELVEALGLRDKLFRAGEQPGAETE